MVEHTPDITPNMREALPAAGVTVLDVRPFFAVQGPMVASQLQKGSLRLTPGLDLTKSLVQSDEPMSYPSQH
jgi:hypothetical protein